VHVLTSVDPSQIAQLRERDEFFWIDLFNPADEEVDRLGEALGLHPVALEDTREFGQRPKLDPYGGQILLVFYSAVTTGDENWPADPVEVHIYLSGDYMVTVRRDECAVFDDLHRDLGSEDTHDEELLVYKVLDALTDAFYAVIEAIEERIDELEAAVLRKTRREQLTRSYRLKQCVHQLHRLVAAQKAQFMTARETIVGLESLKQGARPYLRDIGDHLFQVAGEFQRQMDDLFALTQTYFNANSDRLNAVATRLTIGGTLFVVWTVVTGFFGQNFGWLVNNIESKHAFFLYGVGALVVPTVILLTLFWVKRRDWF
jgi:magnesium transporter